MFSEWKWMFGVLLFAAAHAKSAPISPEITNPRNGHVYILLDSATWREAEAEAVALGGHLATVRNQSEQDWIFQTFGNYKGQQRLLWIGLNDLDKRFHFSWSSGESVSYTQWAPGEPNNVGNGENFVAIFYPKHDQAGKWNDWGDRKTDPIGLPMNGVVEIIPKKIQPRENSGENIDPFPPAFAEIVPSLIITNDARSITLKWPATAAGYFLEATTNLSQPFTTFGYTEALDGDAQFFSVSITNPCLETCPQMFFRLRKP